MSLCKADHLCHVTSLPTWEVGNQTYMLVLKVLLAKHDYPHATDEETNVSRWKKRALYMKSAL